MGFCRRCGEIVPVQAARCKCGGSAVAPAVQWNHDIQREKGSPDRWAEMYVSNTKHERSRPVTSSNVTELAPTPLKSPQKQRTSIDVNRSPTRSTRRFPRPLSAKISLEDDRASHYITSPPVQSPICPTQRDSIVTLGGSLGSAPPDVITSPDNATLAKAYGSVLQRPETLPIHTCASCSAVFPPDATIYPDPQTPSGATQRFFCRPCFAIHGGSKGDCAGCGREVLTATREGGFVESAGNVWHKRCFRCEGCHKEIGHAPMVDLFGLPSCAECFETCLDRRGSPRTRKRTEAFNDDGGLRGRSREGSPVIEELSERLGIKRLPVSEVIRDVDRHSNVSPSLAPERVLNLNDESLPSQFALSLRSKDPSPSCTPRHSPLKTIISTTSSPTNEMEPTTPALSSSSSGSASPHAPSTPSTSLQPLTPNSFESITPKTKSTPTRLSIVTKDEPKCGRCFRSLFSIAGGGKVVTVPAENPTEEPAFYHASCFRCVACGNTFDGETRGHAMFMRCSKGVCHPTCVATDTHAVDCQDLPVTKVDYNGPEQPSSAPPLTRSFPRLGGSEACPGCRKTVSLMEYGVVPGPQNSRWHVNCLVCGGKGARHPRPGCGKKLDSAAKMDREGRVWCKECSLLLPAGTCPSPQRSPTRVGLTPSYTGTGFGMSSRLPEANRLSGQVTGNMFVRSDALMVQLTGAPMRRGSTSPTRQSARSVSPTKGLMPVTRHPRPMGMWKHRSVQEGRGMFLVKQMTGNGL